ncbi:hypothetical protein PCARR_a2116 [Pseudoalteromonas carrageenovora IAM 12662]|uniref:Transposase n=1 Tax=Pseudoalteromonas carrageenovora IAM 12662 TaxID=1314868 RepID=A0ABR9ETC9_PSEVC|nr:hypothetical protein [Pseudoalteromonas carrageenovora IAM 12662]
MHLYQCTVNFFHYQWSKHYLNTLNKKQLLKRVLPSVTNRYHADYKK